MIPDLYHGIPVVLDPNLREYELREARRTWRERLFTRPWRPFTTTRYWQEAVPSSQVLFFGGFYLMHPLTFRALKSIGEVADHAGS